MGKAYSDERKQFYEISEEVIVPVRDTPHMKVKSGIRKRAKKDYEAKRDDYRQKY